MLRRILFSIIALLTLNASVCFAKPINLYDQPQADAKLLGTVESTAGIITIFAPKTGDWIKVGDPRNGNVGWIKSADLKAASGSSSVSITQEVISNGQNPQAFFVQFGQPMTTRELTPAERQALIKQIQQQQQMIQRNMQLMMQDIFNSANQPMVMPVIVMPTTKPATPAATTTPTTTNKK